MSDEHSPLIAPAPNRPRGASVVGTSVICIALAGLALFLEHEQTRETSLDDVQEHLNSDGHLRPQLAVLKVVKEQKLLTAKVEAKVTATMEDASWRGRASATVEAPFTFLYGVNLQNVDPTHLRIAGVLDYCGVTLPKLELLAPPIPNLNELYEVIEVTGTRLRSRAGEMQRKLAYKKLQENAEQLVLPKETMDLLKKQTVDQVSELVKRILGDGTTVRVRFSE